MERDLGRELKVLKAKAHNRIRCIACISGDIPPICKYLDNASDSMKLEAIRLVLEKERYDINGIHRESIKRAFKKVVG